MTKYGNPICIAVYQYSLTQEVRADEAVAEPAGGRAAGEVDAVVREVSPGDAPRQVVVVPHVGSGVAEDVHRRDLRRRGPANRHRHRCRQKKHPVQVQRSSSHSHGWPRPRPECCVCHCVARLLSNPESM